MDTNILLRTMDQSSHPLKQNGADTHNVTVSIEGVKTENGTLRVPLMSPEPEEGGKESPAPTMSFHNITYAVPAKKRLCLPCRRSKDSDAVKNQKSILCDVSGIFRPGLNAIMGPTGSGKTSLLDILAARKAEDHVTGTVLLGDAPRPHNFKCMTGYVIQDDTVMGMLTVRENIAFSAALRLPGSVSQEKRQERVEEVISELGLQHCGKDKVGTELTRGVSGGERKRTSIAMELLTSPSILFLDEPTSGLDATMAQSVMRALKRLANQRKTIILSVHQPRYSIYRMIDTLHLLLHGKTVYHGAAQEALNYFSGLGFVCEPHDNPADFVLDVMSGHIETTDNPEVKPDDDTLQRKSAEEEDPVLLSLENNDREDQSERQSQLSEAYLGSAWYSRTQAELDTYRERGAEREAVGMRRGTVSYRTGFGTQLVVVSRRTFYNMIRNPHTLGTQVMSAIILALLLGGIYFQVDSSYSSGIQNRVGAFLFIVMNHVFGNMAAVDLFIKDRALFIHENVSGFYQVSVYFIAKFLFEVLPTRVIPIIVFSSISYWMIGLRAELAAFTFFTLTLLLTSVAGTSVALLLGASSSSHTTGTVFTALIWVFMMVFSGLLVNLNSLAVGLRWLRYLSIFSYSMNGLTINELKDASMCDVDPHNATLPLCDTGNAYMSRQGIPHSSTWDLWVNPLALLALSTFFLVLTYIQLRRLNKYR